MPAEHLTRAFAEVAAPHDLVVCTPACPSLRLVLRLVDEYSAVTAIVVTTARKALTLFASFLLFPKHVGLGHPVGAALVFGSAFITMKKPAKRPLLPTNMRAV